jgi:hypothetical protein
MRARRLSWSLRLMFSQPKSLPPVSVEFSSALEHPGSELKQSGWKLLRSSDGKMHLDQGNQSLITDPTSGKAIHLDHVKKEAQIFPLQPPSSKPDAQIGSLQAPKPPQAPLSVKDLGTRMIAGHEVEGKSYTYPPFQAAKPPGPPGTQPASAAAQNQPPQVPQVMEVWTSPKLQMPLATRLTGATGKQTTICKQVVPGEPPASAFQIPPDYKIVQPNASSPIA